MKTLGEQRINPDVQGHQSQVLRDKFVDLLNYIEDNIKPVDGEDSRFKEYAMTYLEIASTWCFKAVCYIPPSYEE